jgi:hypothetical protein
MYKITMREEERLRMCCLDLSSVAQWCLIAQLYNICKYFSMIVFEICFCILWFH